MKNINASITLLFSHDGATLELHDDDASITFVRLKMNQKQTCQMLSRLGNTHTVECLIAGTDNLGKKIEVDTLELEMPDKVPFGKEKEIAIELAKANCPDGWTPDLYFNSQKSFSKGRAYCTIRRWVEQP